MATVRARSGRRASVTLKPDDIQKLETNFRGKLLRPTDEGYDQARVIWNAMIDRRPALIAQCAGVSDVQAAVDFARTHDLLVSIKGGGHNIAGNAVCDNGVMIDFSHMRQVRIDPQARVAHVEPGATLADFDREAQTYGLATPLGVNSTTGVAGLTLGGGFGWLTRKYGMTVDNLIACDVVTADGKFITASEKENPDLFWALRGGGGNFGVVTRFEFRLHQVGPNVLGGLMVFPQTEAGSILRKYRDYVKTMPLDGNAWPVMRWAPPLPFLPTEYHGKGIIAFAVFYNGPEAEGQKVLDPIRHFGTLIGEHVGVMPYTEWQKILDPLLTPGARNYWKSHNFTDLTDELIDTLVKQAQIIPSPETELVFGFIGGVANKQPVESTAYPHRDTAYAMNVHGRWTTPDQDDKVIQWARDVFKQTQPFATGGVYVNFLTEEETDRVRSAYGPSYDRLLEVKRKYDPENLFCMNQNIDPKA